MYSINNLLFACVSTDTVITGQIVKRKYTRRLPTRRKPHYAFGRPAIIRSTDEINNSACAKEFLSYEAICQIHND